MIRTNEPSEAREQRLKVDAMDLISLVI